MLLRGQALTPGQQPGEADQPDGHQTGRYTGTERTPPLHVVQIAARIARLKRAPVAAQGGDHGNRYRPTSRACETGRRMGEPSAATRVLFAGAPAAQVRAA